MEEAPTVHDAALMSESSLGEDWNRAEEDATWARERNYVVLEPTKILEMEFGNHRLSRNEHRQTVEGAVEAFVLAHDVARGFQERAEGLGGGGLLCGRVGH